MLKCLDYTRNYQTCPEDQSITHSPRLITSIPSVDSIDSSELLVSNQQRHYHDSIDNPRLKAVCKCISVIAISTLVATGGYLAYLYVSD